ncbi:MAG: hypothetical protein IJR92_04165 [Alphaproteobacteria bacterium]|nr:hypothetical protein [Alphaproteobacteria bacterium]
MNKSNAKWIFLGLFAVIVFIMMFWVLSSDKKTQEKPTETVVVREYPADVQMESVESGLEFSDGLQNPDSVKRFEPDEFGAGTVEIAEYVVDINNDGKPDKITRTRQNSESAHFTYIYKIQMDIDGNLVDVTPNGFQTIEGAECAIQKLKFSFRPDFSVTVISRPLGETWDTPTMSIKTVYTLWGNRIHAASRTEDKIICDVSELFEER